MDNEHIKHIFLDIVEFTKGRSVEAQAEIIIKLNTILRETLSSYNIKTDTLIVIPTGDGLCIALKNISNPFDIHILLGLDILDRLDKYNSETRKIDNMERCFSVRVGINENIDILFKDFNDKTNVAGAGINLAQRIMNNADGGQILVGETVFQTLKDRSGYLNSFKLLKFRTPEIGVSH
jgi:hypothetical protein